MGFVTSLWDPIWADKSVSTKNLKNLPKIVLVKNSFNHFCRKSTFSKATYSVNFPSEYESSMTHRRKKKF